MGKVTLPSGDFLVMNSENVSRETTCPKIAQFTRSLECKMTKPGEK